MFGPRITKVFASRGHALWWSAMVLVTAYCVAADPPAEVAPAPGQEAVARAEKKAPDPWAHIHDSETARAKKPPQDTWSGLEDAARTRKQLLP